MKLNKKDAERYLDDTINQIKETLKVKAAEYIRNNDYMHNFNRAAVKKGISREQAIDGMRLKHEISIDDMRDDLAKGTIPSKEMVNEKFGDIINYYILEKMSFLHKIETLHGHY